MDWLSGNLTTGPVFIRVYHAIHGDGRDWFCDVTFGRSYILDRRYVGRESIEEAQDQALELARIELTTALEALERP